MCGESQDIQHWPGFTLTEVSKNFPEFNKTISKLILLSFKSLIFNASKQLWNAEVKSPFRSAKSLYYNYIEAGLLKNYLKENLFSMYWKS